MALVVTALFGCVNNENPTPRSKTLYGFFDTEVSFTDYSGGENDFSKISALIESRLDLYHRLFDIYHEYPGLINLCTINKSAGESLAVTRELFDFLEYCKELYTLTGGEMNVALGAVLSLWHDAREIGLYLPDENKLKQAANHTDINKLFLDENGYKVQLLDEKMSLDVGAVGKGYAAKMIKDELSEMGVNSFVLNLGGNLTVIGEKPDGTGWRTGVLNPKGGYFAYFTLKGLSCSTSGDYQRYFTVSGVNYHHIIDKESLYPASYYTSVSVISEDPALADALSTALFCLPIAESKNLAKSLGVEAVWVEKDGTVTKSSDFFE